MNTLLIGYRSSGKSSIGSVLAKRLRLQFVDLDDRARSAFAETSIRAIWQVHGEPAWRKAEVAALRHASAQDDQIIALGGGTPMIDEARITIQTAQYQNLVRVVYLQCDADVITTRLRQSLIDGSGAVCGGGGDRPSLTGADPATEAAHVLKTRDPVYRHLADLIYDTTRTTPDQAAEELANLIDSSGRRV